MWSSVMIIFAVALVPVIFMLAISAAVMAVEGLAKVAKLLNKIDEWNNKKRSFKDYVVGFSIMMGIMCILFTIFGFAASFEQRAKSTLPLRAPHESLIPSEETIVALR